MMPPAPGRLSISTCPPGGAPPLAALDRITTLDHPRRRSPKLSPEWPPHIDPAFAAAAAGWEADRDGAALTADARWHAGALGAYSDSGGSDADSWCGADERAGGCPPIEVRGGYDYRSSDGAAGGEGGSGEGEEGCEAAAEALCKAVFDWKAHTAEARDYYGRLVGPGTGRHAPAVATQDDFC
jgi:hypothetical protein